MVDWSKVLDTTARVIVPIGAVVGGIVVVEYVANKFLNPGPLGGSCTQPGTPCYAATNVYVQAAQNCANDLADLYYTIIKGGQPPTTAQLGIIASLQKCINDNEQAAGQAAKPYIPNSVIDFIVEIGGALAAYAITLYYGPRAISKLRTNVKTPPRSGAGAGINMWNAMLQQALEVGDITAVNASVFATSLANFETTEAFTDAQSMQQWAALNIISSLQATQFATQDANLMFSDAQFTEGLLFAI